MRCNCVRSENPKPVTLFVCCLSGVNCLRMHAASSNVHTPRLRVLGVAMLLPFWSSMTTSNHGTRLRYSRMPRKMSEGNLERLLPQITSSSCRPQTWASLSCTPWPAAGFGWPLQCFGALVTLFERSGSGTIHSATTCAADTTLRWSNFIHAALGLLDGVVTHAALSGSPGIDVEDSRAAWNM